MVDETILSSGTYHTTVEYVGIVCSLQVYELLRHTGSGMLKRPAIRSTSILLSQLISIYPPHIYSLPLLYRTLL